ncbi:Aste57867_12896 [Aphanomyces stellatus]|uniref:Aste57867_12896 protein n=1 Tax=Aphanomyces stellatus TaxID=120398 RepID=A0A485KX45_9STRA|nr:hypothetical protein As57867_012848 [Aphanomyces stellatus]VFT89743.1 Aste57867_12896 [Aphanomyces stellatus]
MTKASEVEDAASHGALLDMVSVVRCYFRKTTKLQPVYVVSNPTQKKIYVFDESKSTMKQMMDCNDQSVFVQEDPSSGEFGFLVGSGSNAPTKFAAKSVDDQSAWFDAFTKAGASIREAMGDLDLTKIKSFFDLKAVDIKGSVIPFEAYRGRVSNYTQFVALDAKYRDQGLQILSFPSNSFAQETGTNEEILAAVQGMGVTFPVFEKAPVNGTDTQPVFKYLKHHLSDGMLGSFIKWNYTKFLVDRNGKPFKRYGPNVFPNEIEADIVELLQRK